jgi:hypothetical protein
VKRGEQPNFWISYSDLATGLMMVFLLMMVAFMVEVQRESTLDKKRLSEEAERATQESSRREQIATMARQVSETLTVRPKLADALASNLAPFVADHTVHVDAVTAAVTLREGVVRFPTGRYGWDDLPPTNQQRILEFSSAYLCALLEHEQSTTSSTGIDNTGGPTRRAVSRVLVIGNADLQSAELSTLTAGNNWELTAKRATTIHAQILHHLNGCAWSTSACSVPPGCDRRLLWNFAQHRLHVAGAGHASHCADVPGHSGADVDCTNLPLTGNDRDKAEHRNVTFEVALAQSDLTGLIGDLVRLEDATRELDWSLDALLRPTLRALERGCQPAREAGEPAGCDQIRIWRTLDKACGAEPGDGEPPDCAGARMWRAATREAGASR